MPHNLSAKEKTEEEFTEGIDDLEEDIRAELPDQEHCTWFLNIIKIHSKNIAEQLLDEHKTSLKNEIRVIKETNAREIDSLKRKIEGLQRSDAQKNNENNEIERLQKEVRRNKEKVQETLVTVDNIELMKYINDVQLVGLPEPNDETSDLNQVLKLAREKMGQQLEDGDVRQIIRLGRKSEKNPRDLIVTFKTNQVRETFFNNRKKTASSKTIRDNVYVNDRLTRYRKGLFYRTRHLFKSNQVAAAWTQQGSVLIRERVNDLPRQISSHEELDEFESRGKLDLKRETWRTQSSTNSYTSHLSDYDISDLESLYN